MFHALPNIPHNANMHDKCKLTIAATKGSVQWHRGLPPQFPSVVKKVDPTATPTYRQPLVTRAGVKVDALDLQVNNCQPTTVLHVSRTRLIQ